MFSFSREPVTARVAQTISSIRTSVVVRTADINVQLKKIAEHLGCPFSPEEENRGVIEDLANLCSFHHLSNLEVNKSTGEGCFPQVENNVFFRKGEVGDWMNILTPSMVEKLDQVVEQKLHNSGLALN